jgi:type I restriction enzyme S subunit
MTLRVHPDEIIANTSNSLLNKHPSWERVRIHEIAEIKNGFAFKSSYFNSAGDGIPLIRIRDVGQHHTQTYYSGHFDDEYWVEPGDLIIGMDGDFRVSRWQGPRALLNQRVCRLRVFRPETYEQRFLLYTLPAYLDAIWQHTSSITVKHLSSRTIAEIPVPLPPREEQRRIVDAIEEQFSRLDSSVRSLRRAVRGLRTLRSSALNAIYRGAGPLRAIGDVCAKPQYGWTTRSITNADTVQLLRITDIQEGRVDWATVPHCEGEPDDLARFLLQSGDIVVARSGATVGKTFLLQNPPPAVFASYLIRLRPSEALLSEYLAWFCETSDYWGQISRASSGVAQPNVNGRKLAAIELPVPPIDRQQELVARIRQTISIVDAMEEASGRGLWCAGKLRRAILNDAFSGKLVLDEAAFEPARSAGLPLRSKV